MRSWAMVLGKPLAMRDHLKLVRFYLAQDDALLNVDVARTRLGTLYYEFCLN